MSDQRMTKSTIRFVPVIPYDTRDFTQPLFSSYVSSAHDFGLHQFEYTGWRDEELSWHNNCYFHAHLNPSFTLKISGPEALKFLSNTCVNTFKNFPVGKGKHAIMCNNDGYVMADGILLHTADEEYISYWLSPYQYYALMAGNYNAIGEDLTGQLFLYQLGGPRSLDILEAATGETLRDIKFIHHRKSNIAGKEVRVLRAGMSGSLGYEVHGNIGDAIQVYNAIMDAGKPFEMRRLGMPAYNMTHWENGFPNIFLDYLPPWYDDHGFAGVIARMMPTLGDSASRIGGGKGNHGYSNTKFAGSMGGDAQHWFKNPVELGWIKMINFDHEFVGRAALEKIVAEKKRTMVTLEWNTEDILDIHRTQLEPGTPYADISAPDDVNYGNSVYHADKVLADEREIGISTGRMVSAYFQKMISICTIDTPYSKIGTEVIVLWGEPGTKQKKIRATVTRYPYMNEDRNETVDVDKRK
jgi:glycine cleavage system aminomethyltransferase T